MIAYGIGGMIAGALLEYYMVKTRQKSGNKSGDGQRKNYRKSRYASASTEHGDIRSYLSKKPNPSAHN